MVSKKVLLFYLFAIFLQTNICFAQIVKESKGDSYKWVLVKNQSTGECGAENPQGNTIVPMGKYTIIYQGHNGGYFQLVNNGICAAYSTDGKMLIPFSRGYDNIVRYEKYFGIWKKGLKGACDFDGYEIIAPNYSKLFYSSVDGFNTIEGEKNVSLGITQNNDGLFSGVDYSKKSSVLAEQSLEATPPSITYRDVL